MRRVHAPTCAITLAIHEDGEDPRCTCSAEWKAKRKARRQRVGTGQRVSIPDGAVRIGYGAYLSPKLKVPY